MALSRRSWYRNLALPEQVSHPHIVSNILADEDLPFIRIRRIDGAGKEVTVDPGAIFSFQQTLDHAPAPFCGAFKKCLIDAVVLLFIRKEQDRIGADQLIFPVTEFSGYDSIHPEDPVIFNHTGSNGGGVMDRPHDEVIPDQLLFDRAVHYKFFDDRDQQVPIVFPGNIPEIIISSVVKCLGSKVCIERICQKDRGDRAVQGPELSENLNAGRTPRVVMDNDDIRALPGYGLPKICRFRYQGYTDFPVRLTQPGNVRGDRTIDQENPDHSSVLSLALLIKVCENGLYPTCGAIHDPKAVIRTTMEPSPG